MNGEISTLVEFKSGDLSNLATTGDIIWMIVFLLVAAAVVAGSIVAIRKKRHGMMCLLLSVFCVLGVSSFAIATESADGPNCPDKVNGTIDTSKNLYKIDEAYLGNNNESSVFTIKNINVSSDASLGDVNWKIKVDDQTLFEGNIGSSKDAKFDLDVKSKKSVKFEISNYSESIIDKTVKVNYSYDVKLVEINGKFNINQSPEQASYRAFDPNIDTVCFIGNDGKQYNGKITADGTYSIIGIPSGTRGTFSSSLAGFKDSKNKNHKIEFNPLTYSQQMESIDKQGPELDFYTLEELKTAADDISKSTNVSRFYSEFVKYKNDNKIWYSQSENGGEKNPDYKCNFPTNTDENQYLYLRIIGVNEGSGLTLQTVHALPVKLKYGGDDNGWFADKDFGAYYGDSRCSINNLDTMLAPAYQNVIKESTVATQRTHKWGSSINDIQNVNTKLFPLSYTQMIDQGTEYFSSKYPWYFNNAEGPQFSWYKGVSGKTANDKLKDQCKYNDGTPTNIWLRTVYHKTDNMFLFMSDDGAVYKDNHYSNEYSIAPAFNL